MVSSDSLQMHLHALFHNSTGQLSIVAENAVAPTIIKSRNLPRRTKSLGRSRKNLQLLVGAPRLTKKIPRRAKSAPAKPCLVEEEEEKEAEEELENIEELLVFPPFSRWSSDPSADSLSSLSSLNSLDQSMDRSSMDRSSTDDPFAPNSAFARRTESLTRHAPTSARHAPSRTSSKELENLRSALPPQLPKRKVGEATLSWNAMPPQKPVRKSNSNVIPDESLISIAQSA